MDSIRTLNSIRNIEIISATDNRRVKKYKERTDPFLLSDVEFIGRYRFSKEMVNKIVTLVENEIQTDKRGKGTSSRLQVLVALRCWGRREVQEDSGDLHGLSQATVSRICAKVALALAKLFAIYIKMPNSIMEEEALMKGFKKIRNFPSVIGCIDCTHIKVKKVGGEMAQYYINRKGYYSLNVQVICDHNLRIMNVVARWRGSTHDSRIFNESSIKQQFEDGRFKGRILGDSGYKLTRYLFTPLLRPSTEKEERYNIAHIATRNTVERCFGVWKQRFRCLLDGLTVSLSNAKVTIVALAVLHNLSIEDKPSIVETPAIQNSNYAPQTTCEPTLPAIRRENIFLKSFIERHF